MTGQTQIQEILNSKWLSARARNPSYSLRAFAKKVGIHSGALSAILSGKRLISRRMAVRIADQLCLDPMERERFMGAFPNSTSAKKKHILKSLRIDMDRYEAIAGWQHFAILNLMETSDFDGNPKWISNRLGIKLTDVRLALKRLARLGLTKIGHNGTLVRATAPLQTSDNLESLALRKSHFENLELAKVSLERDPIELRDFTSVTLAIDPKLIPAARARIRKALRDVCQILESDGKLEVYKMNVQLIPLSRRTHA